MKKLILMLAIAGFIANSYAQNLMVSEVPAAVTKTFNKTHKNIDTVQWSKVNDSYKASYDLKKKSMSYTYNTSGKLVMTEKQITLSELPVSVLAYVNENHRGGPINSSLKMTTPAGKSTYMVKLKELDLTFDSRGKFLN